MTVVYRPCHIEHLRYIVAQDVQTSELPLVLTGVAADAFDTFPVRLSAWVGDRCIGAAGLIYVWEGRAHAWAMLSKYIGPYMLPVSRKVRAVLDDYPARRIEMTVLREYEAGNRWARMLGFNLETPNGMVGYNHDGSDANLYARIK